MEKTLSIKKDAASIGWLLLLGQIFMQGVSMIVVFIGLLLHMEGTMMIGSDIASFIANFVILGIFWLLRRKDLPHIETNRDKNPLLLCLSAFAVVLFLNTVVSMLDYITNEAFSVPLSEIESSGSLVVNLLLIAVFPAVVEEFAFRKVIFGTMRQYGFAAAAIFSSLLFGLMHQNFIQLIFAFAMGMVLCVLYERTGKLVWCSLVHFANNAYAVLLTAAPIPEQVGIEIQIVLGLAGLAVLAWLLISKRLRTRRLLQIESEENRKTFSENFRSAMTSLPVIIYSVLCLLMCVLVIFVL